MYDIYVTFDPRGDGILLDVIPGFQHFGVQRAGNYAQKCSDIDGVTIWVDDAIERNKREH